MVDETAIEVLRRFYVAETAYLQSENKDFSLLAPTLHPECVVLHPSSLPYAGRWVGHHGVQAWLAKFGATWVTLAVTDPKFFSSGPDTVFVRCTVHAVARSNGNNVSWPMLQMITMKDGLIIEIEPFMWDTAATLSALHG
ncbi:MAG: nuclear transport factor 2 family protein [Mycobacterium sp.]